MKHSFSAPATKIRRSRKHLAELEAESVSFTETNAASFDMCLNRTPDGLGINLSYQIQGVPEDFGAIIGDIIHNLRSALDLAACEIVRAAGGSDDNVYFPFCKNVHELGGMIKRRNIDRAGPDAVNLIQSLKPYHGGNAALPSFTI
jgi:hypothetical protein